MAGVILSASEKRGILLECRQSFDVSAQLEALTFAGKITPLATNEMMGPDFSPLARTRPSGLVRLPWVDGAAAGQVVRVWQS